MHKKRIASILAASTLTAPIAHAGVDLIAIGSVSGHYEDYATRTAGLLESGVPGNRLGGIGSSLAYAGCNTFLALSDRGPNATPYNAAVDDTTSYIDRFHTLHLSLAPSSAGSPLPFTLTPFVTDTTLLSSKTPLYYGTGAGLGLGTGKPALNLIDHTNYFTARSDGFEPGKPSTNPNNARLDPEGISISNDGETVFISDEYGPYVYQFERATGRRIRSFKLPGKFAVSSPNPVGAAEISGNTSGRVANKGMEGVATTPNGRTLVVIVQSPLIQDGGTAAPYTRIVRIDIASGATREFAYPLTNIGTVAKPKYGTLSDIVAVNNNEFLADERDGKGLGDNSTAVVKKLYKIDLTAAADVSNITGAAGLAAKALTKTLFLDIAAALNASGISGQDVPSKIEGLTFGPDVVVDGVAKHTLFISSDNDFLATVTDSNHPAGVENPSKWFVFAVDAAELPGYIPQQFDTDGPWSFDDDRGARDECRVHAAHWPGRGW
jgi:hypothetical protein